MAYALILIGLLLTIAGVRNRHDELFALVQGDFTGPNSFIFWLAAIAIIGGLGYIPEMKGLSNAFLALVLIVLVLNQGTGIFDRITAALQQSTSGAPDLRGTVK